jgi:hypothetical protein
LKRYLEDFPVTPDILGKMLQAESAAAFAELLAELETAVRQPVPAFFTPF